MSFNWQIPKTESIMDLAANSNYKAIKSQISMTKIQVYGIHQPIN